MIDIGFLIVGSAILILLFQKTLNLSKYVKLFFILFLVCGLSSALSLFLPSNMAYLIGIIGSLWEFAAFSFVLLHSSLVLGNKKTSILFSVSFLMGLFFELIGVKYGIFGSNYYYTTTPFFFGLVPLMTPFSWVILIYTAYSISNIFLKGIKAKKPSFPTSNLPFFISIIVLLSSISGLLTVNLDMIIDPVATSPQIASWVWINGGSYFGIPLTNFLGWFIVTFFSTLIFRLYESFSLKQEFNKGFNSIDLYLPILYLIYFLVMAANSVYIGQIEYVLIGTTTTFSFLLIILLMYLNSGYE